MIPYHRAFDNAKNKWLLITLFILHFYMYTCRTQAKLLAKSTGCKGSYSLMRLPCHDRVNQTVPDAMHTVKDCIEKIVYLITGNIMLNTLFKAVIIICIFKK